MYKEEKSFVKEKKRKEKLAAIPPVEKMTKKQKNSANSSSAIAQSRSEYMREYQAREKTLQNTLLMRSLMTNRKIALIHQVLLPNLYQSTHERISSTEKKNIAKYPLNEEFNDKQKNSANSSSATAKSLSEYT
ncbi:hypothetical protein TNCV_4167221 [Trichonephila clavipes]|nr:hypothetical protein TNCV_4167221 [Trichonephila clavipes]